MNLKEIEQFERFLLESFEGGKIKRELRLNDQQVEFILQNYPHFKLTCETNKDVDGKCWYLVDYSNQFL